ncbi:hypothetical protein CORC01_09958 [Colletotrichum orchidophilum]|uniref:Uncharacterized protein n=1 Tax=Colletotrichum orchidophilum TaxID=1209926 RepID=A0A1G4B033_9PEZI|nr:uncharacterized protein CORC01_09958 [Colletotrichum orchidophilum]OHE94741.1 hypothetical protein CORC01_09958 [Colletotrichum orchidophilum]
MLKQGGVPKAQHQHRQEAQTTSLLRGGLILGRQLQRQNPQQGLARADASKFADQDEVRPPMRWSSGLSETYKGWFQDGSLAAPYYRTGKMEVQMQCWRIPSVGPLSGNLGPNVSTRFVQAEVQAEVLAEVGREELWWHLLSTLV